jgi:hypothetical protein
MAPRSKATHIFDCAPQDFYPEPSSVDDALFAVEPFVGPILDPACGLGRIVEAANRAGHCAYGHDIVRRSSLCEKELAFFASSPRNIVNIVSNPPYHQALEFAKHALNIAQRKVVLLLQYGFLFALKRVRLFRETPLRTP